MAEFGDSRMGESFKRLALSRVTALDGLFSEI
jgi:hypothetical protein